MLLMEYVYTLSWHRILIMWNVVYVELKWSFLFHRVYRSERSSASRTELAYEWKGMAFLSYPPMPPILSFVAIFILVYLVDTSKCVYCSFFFVLLCIPIRDLYSRIGVFLLHEVVRWITRIKNYKKKRIFIYSFSLMYMWSLISDR